jgi:hypothetical protein
MMQMIEKVFQLVLIHFATRNDAAYADKSFCESIE